MVPSVSKVFAFKPRTRTGSNYAIPPRYDCRQTIPIVDPGRYLESPVNCSSDSRRSTNSRACVKMCLATRISRSNESADFSNVIAVVAVADMSVLVVTRSQPPSYTGHRTGLVAASCRRRSHVGGLGRVSETCSSSKFRVAHCRKYKSDSNST